MSPKSYKIVVEIFAKKLNPQRKIPYFSKGILRPAAKIAAALVFGFSLLPTTGAVSPTAWAQAPTLTTHIAQDAFTFVRIRWNAPDYARFMRFYFSAGPPWSHDYPTAEENMYTAIRLLTRLPVTGEAKILTLESDEIFDYPLLYICEIGVWNPPEKNARRLREYLRRGGFLIVDDFRGRREIANLIHQMQRVVPEFTYRKLTIDHPIFHCFFEFNELVHDSPYLSAGYFPEYYGWFDPHGRLAAIVNYNNDVGDGWEWPEEDEIFSAEAFKLGINYIIYALTH